MGELLSAVPLHSLDCNAHCDNIGLTWQVLLVLFFTRSRSIQNFKSVIYSVALNLIWTISVICNWQFENQSSIVTHKLPLYHYESQSIFFQGCNRIYAKGNHTNYAKKGSKLLVMTLIWMNRFKNDFRDNWDAEKNNQNIYNEMKPRTMIWIWVQFSMRKTMISLPLIQNPN